MHSSKILTLAIFLFLQMTTTWLGLHDAQQSVQCLLYLDAVYACNAMRGLIITCELACGLVTLSCACWQWLVWQLLVLLHVHLRIQAWWAAAKWLVCALTLW